MKTIVSALLFMMAFVSCTTQEEKIIVKNASPKKEKTEISVVPNRMLTVEIEGMSCEMNCGGSIRKGLKKTGAVSRVEFVWVEDAEKQVTKISYDDKKIDEAKIVALIEKMNDGQFTTHGGKSEKISIYSTFQMKLNYREIGSGQPLIILHGLFGSSDNWQTQAKKFAVYFRVILVDLRNHGHSGWSTDSSYASMAEDVFELMQELKLEKTILLGHSMGGKVAMHVVQTHEKSISKLIVADMGIKEYPPHHQHILEGIHSVKLEDVSSRGEAEKQLSQHIDSEGVKQFLLKNLYWREKGKLAWRMNVDVLENSMPLILSPLPQIEVFTPTLFIRGELSNYLLDEDIPEIENLFPDSQYTTISQAGHWVHAEKPDEFVDAVLAFCLR